MVSLIGACVAALGTAGDSMIQIVDSYLKQRLRPRGVRVRSDAHSSTGISKPSLLEWQAQAHRQARSHPDVVFTPGRRYRATMRIGRTLVRVRQADGVHLSSAGASLAASIVVRALRRERILL